jgi:hypothetical protein
MNDDIERWLRDAPQDAAPQRPLAADVVRSLPPRRRVRGSIAILTGASIAGAAAASLAPDLVHAIVDVLQGSDRALVDGLVLLASPFIVLLSLATRVRRRS